VRERVARRSIGKVEPRRSFSAQDDRTGLSGIGSVPDVTASIASTAHSHWGSPVLESGNCLGNMEARLRSRDLSPGRGRNVIRGESSSRRLVNFGTGPWLVIGTYVLFPVKTSAVEPEPTSTMPGPGWNSAWRCQHAIERHREQPIPVQAPCSPPRSGLVDARRLSSPESKLKLEWG